MIRILACAGWLVASAAANDAVVVVHIFRMKTPELSALLSKNLRGDRLMQDILDKVETGSVQWHDTKLVRSKQGGKARLTSHSELIYPTEWASWELPPDAEFQKRHMDRAQTWWAAWKFMPVLVGFTGEFEVRGLGETFGVSLPSSKATHRGWSWRSVTRKKDLVHFTQPMADRPPFESRFPQFETVSLTGQFQKAGSWRVAGSMTLPNEGGEPGHQLLAIMKVERVEVNP